MGPSTQRRRRSSPTSTPPTATARTTATSPRSRRPRTSRWSTTRISRRRSPRRPLPRSRPRSSVTPRPRAPTLPVATPLPTPSEQSLTTVPSGTEAGTQQDLDEPVTATGGGLVRLRLAIAYDGTALHGWGRQPGHRTVQGELEQALAMVLRCDVGLTVAGRTDAGVHATGQVAHCDVPRHVWEEQRAKLVRRLRGVLPPDVAVPAVEEAPPE